MEATTVRKHRMASSVTNAWNQAKNLNNSQKLELITLLAQSIQPTLAPSPMKRYTMDEINAMLDEAEAEIAAGGGIPDEEVWADLDEELEREKHQEPEMMEAV